MRGWLNDVNPTSHRVQIGDVMRAGTVGEVIEIAMRNLPSATMWLVTMAYSHMPLVMGQDCIKSIQT